MYRLFLPFFFFPFLSNWAGQLSCFSFIKSDALFDDSALCSDAIYPYHWTMCQMPSIVFTWRAIWSLTHISELFALSCRRALYCHCMGFISGGLRRWIGELCCLYPDVSSDRRRNLFGTLTWALLGRIILHLIYRLPNSDRVQSDSSNLEWIKSAPQEFLTWFDRILFSCSFQDWCALCVLIVAWPEEMDNYASTGQSIDYTVFVPLWKSCRSLYIWAAVGVV